MLTRFALLTAFSALIVVACAAETNDRSDEQDIESDVRHRDAGQDAGHSVGQDAGAADAHTPSGLPTGTIFTVLMENHDFEEIVGSPNAPYLSSLINEYGLAANYADSKIHPSLPNYLMLISGATQYNGGTDLLPTESGFPANQPNLGTQLEAAHIKWRSYQESMGTPCKLSDDGNYAPRHDPFLYFKDMQQGTSGTGLCAQRNVDYSQFATDLAAGTYRYMWITPNLLDDGHNPQSSPVTGLKQTDDWASTEIPKIMASDAFKNDGVIFLTWDEAEGRHGDSKDQVPMIVISPRMKSAGFKSNTAYSHKSYLATVEDMLGLPRLATVKTEPAMADFFAP